MTPYFLIQRHVESMLHRLPGTLDGDVESVHQARIATRRLREVLRFDDQHRETAETARRAGRELGRVRELDVISAMLDLAAERLPAAAGVVASAKRAVRHRQREQRRDMVKALERLDLEGLPGRLARGRPLLTWRRDSAGLFRQAPWVQSMWTHITSRSSDAVEAVRRAPGIYFPNRSHQARIGVKKLRYAVEAAVDVGIWKADRLLKDLRRIQATLGDVHDAQVLIDSVDELAGQAPPTETALLKALWEDDIARGHREYTRRRERLFAIAEACTRAAAQARSASRTRRTLVAASVVAVPLVVFGRHRG